MSASISLRHLETPQGVTAPHPLSPDQLQAVETLTAWLAQPFDESGPWFRLSGSAGMGKTYLLGHLPDSFKGRVVFTAPTNKAVRALKSAISTPSYSPEFRTIFSLLGLTLQPSGEVKVLTAPEDPIDLSAYRLIIVDEASMVSSVLMKEILSVVKLYRIRVLFIGDPAQLPPVGEASSPIWSLDLPPGASFALSKVMRHDNAILDLATATRKQIGHPAPCLDLKPFEFAVSFRPKDGGVIKFTPSEFALSIKESCALGHFSTPTGAKVIAWRNVTVDLWNRVIRSHLWGAEATTPWLPGDRVVFVSPAKDLQNEAMAATDDEGIVNSSTILQHPLYPELRVYQISITLDDNRRASALVLHPSSIPTYNDMLNALSSEAKARPRLWKKFWEFKEAFHQLRHAYALTAHRAQGSTYDRAYVCFQDILLNRDRQEAFKCFYVAATRPKTWLYLG
jgi:hypothetical protein